MRLSIRTLTAAALGLALGAAACNDEELFPPPNQVLADPMFTRYVSMGNSITAGFQSGGINQTTQNQSYAVLLANAMGTTFYAPLMNLPGCPSLYTNVFTQTRVPGPPCALRVSVAVPPPYINNTAVPAAEAIDIYNNLDPASNANALTTFFLGGLTQTQMMQKVAPTFVSVWIGNNDILGAATNSANGGDTTLITPPATFNARFDAIMDSVDAVNPQGGAMVGVAKVTAVPFFSAGAVYWAIKNGLVPGAPALPDSFFVDNNCAPSGPVPGIPGARGDSVLVGFPYGGTLLGTAAAGVRATLSCADTIAQIIAPRETVVLLTAVAQYNAHISGAATARGWAYFDPNPTLDSLRALPPPFAVAPFPSFGAPCTANPFGTAFSCDGVHPSASTHKLIANKLREAVNTTYGTAVPAIP
jgi:lysophospholipase L1-like esterase